MNGRARRLLLDCIAGWISGTASFLAFLWDYRSSNVVAELAPTILPGLLVGLLVLAVLGARRPLRWIMFSTACWLFSVYAVVLAVTVFPHIRAACAAGAGIGFLALLKAARWNFGLRTPVVLIVVGVLAATLCGAAVGQFYDGLFRSFGAGTGPIGRSFSLVLWAGTSLSQRFSARRWRLTTRAIRLTRRRTRPA